jgi:hypothetical protein
MEKCRKCKIEFESFLMKNGKPSKKCPKHYELQIEAEKRRPKRVRTYPKKSEMTLAQLEVYERKTRKRREEGRVKRDTQKYREKKKQEIGIDEFLKQNAQQAREWRAKNKEHYSRWRKTSLGSTLSYYKYCAKTKNIKWNLLDDYALCLFQQPCHYCGEVNLDIKLTGIDRVDNSKDYITSNVVACCKICNMMKKDLDRELFIKICKHIAFMNKLVKGYSKDYLSPDSFRDYKKMVTYSHYKHTSKRRNKLVFISKQKFQEITLNNCYICNKMNTRYHQNGIDRKDNDMEYIVENCYACCGRCNYLKNKFDYNKILDKCFKITIINL